MNYERPVASSKEQTFSKRKWSALPVRFWGCLACSSRRRAHVPWLAIKFAILQSARLAHIWEHDSKESSLPCHMVFPSEGKQFSSILKKTLCSSASILAVTGSIIASVPSNICHKERKKIWNRFNPFRKHIGNYLWSNEFCVRFAETDWSCYLLFYRGTYSR